MASNLKKKTVSVHNVIKSKSKSCGKVFNPDENETNIKMHFGVCSDANPQRILILMIYEAYFQLFYP